MLSFVFIVKEYEHLIKHAYLMFRQPSKMSCVAVKPLAFILSMDILVAANQAYLPVMSFEKVMKIALLDFVKGKRVAL